MFKKGVVVWLHLPQRKLVQVFTLAKIWLVVRDCQITKLGEVNTSTTSVKRGANVVKLHV